MTHSPAGLEQLELQLLASGATQHAFVRSDRPDDGWVYKTPAIIDSLLPSRPAAGRLAPMSGSKRLAYSLLYGIPRTLWRRLGRKQHPLLAQRMVAGYVGVADRGVALHLRRSRIASFRRVLRIHHLLRGEAGADAGLLPWRALPDVRAVLCIAEIRRRYRGPILVQRRAELFFERSEELERFDGSELVRIQHRLWRRGIALADGAGALGPQGWALLERRVCLADTGSLTRDLRLARWVLAPERMERIQEHQIERQPDATSRERARAYYERVRLEINAERLGELWCEDRRGGGRR